MSETETYSTYRVWHIPQVPGTPFVVECDTLAEAQTLVAVLANYDLFQYAQRVKPDYCNASGIEQMCEDGEWCEVDEDEQP